MEDNSDNSLNEKLNNINDVQAEDSDQNSQKFETEQMEDENINNEKEHLEYPGNLGNNKNGLLGRNTMQNCNQNKALNSPQKYDKNYSYNNNMINPTSYNNNINSNKKLNLSTRYDLNNSYQDNIQNPQGIISNYGQNNRYQDNIQNRYQDNIQNPQGFINNYDPNNIYNNNIQNPQGFISNYKTNRGIISPPPQTNQNINYKNNNQNPIGFFNNYNTNKGLISSPQPNQNINYNNNYQIPDMNGGNNLSNINEILNLGINIGIALDQITNNSNQQKNYYSFQDNPLNNSYNSQNMNHFNQSFQNQQMNLINNNKKDMNINYLNFNRQHQNYNSYNRIKNNKLPKINKHNNSLNISNNNQKRENLFDISLNNNINNEKNKVKQNINNNINLSRNEKSLSNRKLSLNEIIFVNKLKIIPNINDFIREKANEINYKLTTEDNEILDNNNFDKNKNIFFNEYMFYSGDKISIYSPHILKGKKNVLSILLPEKEKKLNILDFQYSNYHNNMNDIFFLTLQRRINEYNIFLEKNDDIEKKENNDKKFGFCKQKNGDNYFLYSIIDDDIIKDKLKQNDLESLRNNLIMNNSQINPRSSIMEVYDQNMDYLQGLTFEELILFIILDRLKNKYELLPRILFYENFMTIFGEKVKLFYNNPSGYKEIDYVIYSKDNCKYKDDSPLIIQNYYNYNKQETDLQFEIKKDTLYFFELKSSAYYINDNFFDTTFNKCQEFANLYESKNMINKDVKKEIMLIYDNKSDSSLPQKYEKKIMDFLKKNKDYSFSIVYSIKTYYFFSHSLAIKKYDDIKNENKILTKKYDDIKNENKILENKIKNLNDEIEKLKVQINGSSNQNQINNK